MQGSTTDHIDTEQGLTSCFDYEKRTTIVSYFYCNKREILIAVKTGFKTLIFS